MTTWQQFTTEQPSFAAEVQARFEAATHHVLATLCADGSPRVSGTEVQFGDIDITVGSMSGARKARDLLRDPRFALHSNPGDGTASPDGLLDAKLTGRAEEITSGPLFDQIQQQDPAAHLFRLELDSVVTVGLTEERDALLIRHWRPESGLVETHRP
ncbi:pyridoxamine 5'-phosphate oxidase family protein [Lipingzhangella sp. LS1_29]|uniref:Pyridoxamine 5'-phosphate oxidase family protein n=1 Tax=Lipingzhangella rawalii TaxID=2055835 RepID=A0ABU2H8P1_9ACTN|nr:pyridoxamine 5'-phosphate oxidase family protein [Lipingzhangella rawalii]MDS1271224.1 pyridoxamine 5'-phosphate oxidase family protein [Lipingzhangella rawalii]